MLHRYVATTQATTHWELEEAYVFVQQVEDRPGTKGNIRVLFVREAKTKAFSYFSSTLCVTMMAWASMVF